MKTIKKVVYAGVLTLALGVGYKAVAQQENQVDPDFSEYIEQIATEQINAGAELSERFSVPYEHIKNERYVQAKENLGDTLTTLREGWKTTKENLQQAPVTDEARQRLEALIDVQINRITELLE